MIVIYQKPTKADVEKGLNDALVGVKAFFENNPKRRVCRFKWFFGEMKTLPRKGFEEKLKEIAKETETNG